MDNRWRILYCMAAELSGDASPEAGPGEGSPVQAVEAARGKYRAKASTVTRSELK